jgi:Flp pilus assembly pilin Flp
MRNWKNLVRKVHESEDGAVSLETVLVVGAIAIPILIFVIKVGWPMIQTYFTSNMSTLQQDATAAQTGTGG